MSWPINPGQPGCHKCAHQLPLLKARPLRDTGREQRCLFEYQEYCFDILPNFDIVEANQYQQYHCKPDDGVEKQYHCQPGDDNKRYYTRHYSNTRTN